MPWQRIDSHYVKQDQPGLETTWFWDTADRGGGELLLWIDEGGHVQSFQLSYEQWPSGRHYVARWTLHAGLQVGMVDDGAGGGMRLRKQSEIMRFMEIPDPKITSLLYRYFRTNASILGDDQRALITGIFDATVEASQGA